MKADTFIAVATALGIAAHLILRFLIPSGVLPTGSVDWPLWLVLAGGGWNSGYGNYVIIDHGNGYTTLYAHMNSVFVEPGETVSRGQQVGTMGNTGNSTGPHLHFEIRYNDVPYSPTGYLK